MNESWALSIGIGVGVMGIAAYVKTNLESRHDLKIVRRELKEKDQKLTETLLHGMEIDPRLLIARKRT